MKFTFRSSLMKAIPNASIQLKANKIFCSGKR